METEPKRSEHLSPTRSVGIPTDAEQGALKNPTHPIRHTVETINLKDVTYDEVDDRTRLKIRNLYARDVNNLGELLGRNLSKLWFQL